MNKYNYAFESIIKKYFGDESINNDMDINNLIGEIIEENKGDSFALWGSGEHTENLYKYFSPEIKDAKCIIDNNENLRGTKFLGFEVSSSNEIERYDLNTIFISSYGGRLDIKTQAKQLIPNCNIVDFYEKLEEKGIKLSGPFYTIERGYLEIYKSVEKYENCDESLNKQLYLRNIILLYLNIRDIYNAKKYINIYIKADYDESYIFKNLLLDIEKLVNELSVKIKKRDEDDIFLLLLDSLRAKDVFNYDSPMKYINSILNKSKYFTNAFSPSLTTYESMTSILTGKLPFEDKLYTRKLVEEKEVEFIKKTIDRGYGIKIYTVEYWNIIEGENIVHGKYSNFMSKNIWNALCDLAENKDKKTLYLLYFWQETHPPHFCGVHTINPIEHTTPYTCNDNVQQSQENYSTQYKDCLRYIDTQLEYYFNIMGDDIKKVMFSDHGQIVENAMDDLKDINTLASWHDERYHIPLILQGKNIVPSRCEEIFSMVNFNDIMVSLIDNNDYINSVKYIEVNFSKMYNETIKKKYLNAGHDDYIHGFKVLRDNKYKIVITGNEKYKVYVLPEQFKEITDEGLKNEIRNCFSKVADTSVPQV